MTGTTNSVSLCARLILAATFFNASSLVQAPTVEPGLPKGRAYQQDRSHSKTALNSLPVVQMDPKLFAPLEVVQETLVRGFPL
jgi:hypothetical protein